MRTRFIEVTNGIANWGKFMVGVFDQDEIAVKSVVDVGAPLVRGRGWGPGHVLVLDLQTGEGATFRMGGMASADLDKHRVWVCPLFEPFLEWLYLQPDPMRIPPHIDLPQAAFAFAGYRRSGPDRELATALDVIDHMAGALEVLDGGHMVPNESIAELRGILVARQS